MILIGPNVKDEAGRFTAALLDERPIRYPEDDTSGALWFVADIRLTWDRATDTKRYRAELKPFYLPKGGYRS